MNKIEKPNISELDKIERKFLLPEIPTEDITNEIMYEGKEPNLILAIAPCRTGTTAQLKVFSSIQIDSYYQPIKAIQRNAAYDKVYRPFIIPSEKSNPVLFIKETLGPYNKGEVIYNPLNALLNSGYDKEKITVMFEMRDPIDTYVSWVKHFLPELDSKYRSQMLEVFILAYKEMSKYQKLADSLGIKKTSYIYESLKNNTSDRVYEKIFKNLGLEFSDNVTKNWPIGVNDNHIHFAEEPDVYEPLHLHDEVKKATELKYMGNTLEHLRGFITDQEIEKIRESGINDIYKALIIENEKEFNIKIDNISNLDLIKV
jgi:hypothetical protein